MPSPPGGIGSRLPFWSHIRTQLIGTLVLIATLPIMLAAGSTITLNRSQSQGQTLRQLEAVAELKQDQLEGWLSASSVVLDVLLSPPVSAQFALLALAPAPRLSDQLAANAYLVRVTAPHPTLPNAVHFQTLFVYTPDGHIVAASDPIYLGRIVTRQSYFSASLTADQIHLPAYVPNTNELTIVVTRRIQDARGETIAILGGNLDLSVLGMIMAHRGGLGETGETYLVSRESSYLLSPSRVPGYPLTKAYASDGIIHGLRGEDGAALYANYRNPPVPVMGAYRWIPELHAVLVAEISQSEALATVVTSQRISMGITFGASLSAIVVGLLVATRIGRPITALTQVAARISAGDLSPRTTIRQHNEIGLLADGFNSMADQLQQTLLNLEERIADRTHALLDAKQEAEAANHLKTRFLATMSHELRTPLNAIINFSKFIVEDGGLAEQQTDLIERIRLNGIHLLSLINDILDFSKIEAGQMSLFLEAIDLRPLLEDAVQTTRILVADKPITVTLECPAVLPPLTLDRVRMRQVLLNLLSNAAKFTERGSIVVHVVMGDPAILTIQIADSGCGIDSSDQERIFAEFQQVQDVLTRDHQGTGLGLPISKRLVELHGGTMAVTSQVGVGTTFAFNLPVVPPPGIPTSTPESGFASAAEPGGFGNARATTTDILVIDDDPDAHRTLHLVLERAGYQVAHVLDSRTVLPALEAAQPRLVILDIQMPYLDGWEVLAQIKTHARFGRIPVLMCSVVDRQHLGVLLGVQDHLVKPIQPEILIKTVTRWLTAVAAILIVDDDADARQIIARPLLRHGYTVYEAPDGAEGIRIAQQQQPALIILDLMMPGMDGFRVLAAVRADPRLAATPVLVVSAKDLDVQERALLTSQAQGYLTKDLLAVTDMLDLIHPYLQGASPV